MKDFRKFYSGQLYFSSVCLHSLILFRVSRVLNLKWFKICGSTRISIKCQFSKIIGHAKKSLKYKKEKDFTVKGFSAQLNREKTDHTVAKNSPSHLQSLTVYHWSWEFLGYNQFLIICTVVSTEFTFFSSKNETISVAFIHG